jgi:sugar porter (SP) family MFS transporter
MLKGDNLNRRISKWTITVALAGFLFGFDTVVISGANQPIKDLWDTSPLFHGIFIMSAALWGTVVGAIFGGWPCDKFGRKQTLLWIGILYTISALGSALATGPIFFSIFRFIGGIGVGASSIAAPTYISEISNAKSRGSLVARYQFNIVFGIFIAFFSNYLLIGFDGDNDWRWMLGIEAFPAIVYCVLVLNVSESPRWLIMNNKKVDEAKNILTDIEGKEKVDEVISRIQQTNNNSKSNTNSVFLFSRSNNKLLMLAFLLAFFNQMSGINFVLYYAPEILENAGFASSDSLFSSISIGLVNLIFTLLGMGLIDKVGRRQLLKIGSIGYIIGLLGVAWTFYVPGLSPYMIYFLCIFIGAHAIGQGAVIWVFISEIFPNNLRARGQSFGSSVHWIFAALITLITPVFLDKEKGIFGENPYPIFLFFAIMMFLQLLWVIFFMPETKGTDLENIGENLSPSTYKSQETTNQKKLYA